MTPEYIIVQAGGKGTRMGDLTKNKPKALVSISNRPMLFHLFEKYPDKKFVIIGDYKIDVLRDYLAAFAKVDYLVVDAGGANGTCSGVRSALDKIPDNMSFMLVWSDLILPNAFDFPEAEGNYVGISKEFQCRWRYENGGFAEEPSTEHGVAGLFLFSSKNLLASVPQGGEFVRWLQSAEIDFDELPLSGMREYGLFSEYKKTQGEQLENRCRPFNRLTVSEDRIVKEGADAQGQGLAVRERAWYKYVKERGFEAIPEIFSYEPLEMERIGGGNVFEYELTYEQKSTVLKELVGVLRDLHKLDSDSTDYFSIHKIYVEKTFDRLDKVRNLVPYANEKTITVNGRNCRNVFFHLREVERLLDHYLCSEFKLIHGDCTFSNILLRDGSEPVLIDPRGYFGNTEMFGDPAYDWAKLYYSIVGNYDQFNLKRFDLSFLGDREVSLYIESNNWEDMEEEFIGLVEDEVQEQTLKLLHSLIWLSLTTYAWDDYDSICAAFYNGLYYFEEALQAR